MFKPQAILSLYLNRFSSEQAYILDGNKFVTWRREGGRLSDDVMTECAVLYNKDGDPLLASSTAAASDSPQVCVCYNKL